MTDSREWQILSGLPAWQVTEIPRPRDDPQGAAGDGGIPQRTAALASAYGCDAPVAFGWVRDRPGGPIQVLAAGPALPGGHDGEHTVLMVPGGARGTPVTDGQMARMLAAVPCWTRISGITDALRAETSPPAVSGGAEAGPSLEDGLLPAWLDAFAWLLLAEPVGEDTLNEMAADAAREQDAAGRDGSSRGKLAARRFGARHAELREGITTGMWRVHLLAGAATPEDAGRVARLVCASADLRGLPYGLTARRGTGPLPGMLIAASDGGPAATRQPYEMPAAMAQVMNDRSWWDTPMSAGPWGGQPPADRGRQWPDAGHAAAPVSPAEAYRQAEDERDTSVPQSPFIASTRLVAALARAPAAEVPGIRFRLRPQFDVTPETASGGGGAVTAGTVLDQNRVPAGTLALSLASLNRHCFVTGATGGGKSQTVRNLLEQATSAGIPWLVIEPAKAEYRLMAARLPGTQVITIRPGDLSAPPAGINPLEPAPGPGGSRFPLQTHADLLRALFLAAFDADEPFPQVLSAALSRCYERAGWDLVTGQPAVDGTQPGYPSVEDLQAAAVTVVNEIGYGREVAGNVRGFVQVRLSSLRLGTTGRFVQGGHPLDFAALLGANVVVEIEDAGDDHDKAFLIGVVLIRLTEHLRLRHRHEGPAPPRLRHLTVIEEAHRLLRQPPQGTGAGPAAHAVEMFAGLLAEIRAYGEGLVIAEQIPAKLIPDVIKNTAVKIVHRLPAADDRDTVGATMNLTEPQSQYLVTLAPGEAAVFADGMDYPVLVRMPDGTAREACGQAGTASPAGIVGRRSVTCGPACQQQPCTLTQIRAAQNTARDAPAVTLWAELAVLGYLTGYPPPVPRPELTARLLDLDPQVLQCALSHAADLAVQARAAAIGPDVEPAALAVHVARALRDFAAGGHPCPPPAPQWLAPACRWNLLVSALETRVQEAGPDAPPHPGTSVWDGQYGRQIPGSTSGEQLATARSWKQAAWAQADPALRRTLIRGARDPSAVEEAAGSRAQDRRWRQQLTAALNQAFTGATWALPWLAPRRRPATRNR